MTFGYSFSILLLHPSPPRETQRRGVERRVRGVRHRDRRLSTPPPPADAPPDARVAVDIAMIAVPAINLGSAPFLNCFHYLSPHFLSLTFKNSVPQPRARSTRPRCVRARRRVPAGSLATSTSKRCSRSLLKATSMPCPGCGHGRARKARDQLGLADLDRREDLGAGVLTDVDDHLDGRSIARRLALHMQIVRPDPDEHRSVRSPTARAVQRARSSRRNEHRDTR